MQRPSKGHESFTGAYRPALSGGSNGSGGSLTGGSFSSANDKSRKAKLAGLAEEQLPYCAHYSEENVHRLIGVLLENEQVSSVDELSVVFIGNTQRQLQLWGQKDAPVEERGRGQRMVRPYHVILVQTPPRVSVLDGLVEGLGSVAVGEARESSTSSRSSVPSLSTGPLPPTSLPSYAWDPDATVPLPCRLTYYCANVLRVSVSHTFSDKLARYYRVIPAAAYLEHFASDRVHQRGSDGAFVHAPPEWPTIVNRAGSTSTIAHYWDLAPPKTPWHLQDAASPWGRVMDEHAFLDFFHVPRTQSQA